MAADGTVLPAELWETTDESVKADLLEAARIAAIRSDEEVSLSEDEVALLYNLMATDGPAVRGQAIEILSEWGPVTWEDVERWLLDEDERVRGAVLNQVGMPTAMSDLCITDRLRCARIFARSARMYHQFPRSYYLALEDREWVDPLWSQFGPLLDVGDVNLNSHIICGDLEDFLLDCFVAVDDPRVQSWIKGDSIERKMALLSVVQWFGAQEPWQREIAEQLTEDHNQTVSSTAKDLLAGKPIYDIQCRKWAEDQ